MDKTTRKEIAPMKTAVIYARYSSERQTEQSIEGQLRECMAYAEHHDMMVVDTYIDRAMIGTNDNRNDFQRMLKDAQKGVYTHKTEGTYTNAFPRIVPQHLFETVHLMVSENRYGKHPEDVVYLLRNKMKCGYCGKSVTSESGTSRNGTVVRYYKCSTRKKDSTKCHKAPIRKEILEQLIVDATVKVLDNPENIDLVADRVLEAHDKRLRDTAVINILEAERDRIRKALDNMLHAVEQGIITSSTKQRIEELEAALEIAEGKVLIEKSKDKVQITQADIKKFIRKALKKEPRLMIKLLVKDVILYDDKVEIYYNCIEKKGPDDLEHQAFCIYRQDCDIDPKELGLRHNVMGCKLGVEMYF